MKIAIVGLGLIGGSFARTIKAKTTHYVAGSDTSRDVVSAAIDDGSIDDEVSNFSGFDIIIIALYPHDTVTFLEQHINEFSPHCVVLDTCGVKEFVCNKATPLFNGHKAAFLGGHPMAGREFSGYHYSLPTLFEGASMILTPEEHTPEWATLKTIDFCNSLGFGKITKTTPMHHDRVIAYTSQLAHVVSSAYMQSPMGSEYMGFSAGSFADLTRVAKLNPDMWTELFLCNQTALVTEIDTIISSLSHFREAISGEDKKELRDMLQKGSDTKEQLSKK